MKKADPGNPIRHSALRYFQLARGLLGGLPRSRWSVPGLSVLAGLSAGLASPEGAAPWLWVWVYTPLFLALDIMLRRAGAGEDSGVFRSWRLWGRALACCMALGIVQAALVGGWVVNTAYVFGALPLPLAHAANLLGYGGLFGLEAFFFLALPFLLGWRWPGWGFLLVMFWATVLQSFLPRFFAWTYGMFLHPTDFVLQTVDILGTEGLNLPVLALHLLLFGIIREAYAPGAINMRTLRLGALGLALFFAAAQGYGYWRTANLAAATERGRTINLVAVQPSFSLRRLASNPALTHSDRDRSLSALFGDTEQALGKLRADPAAPTVVVWPESVYPAPYFRADQARKAVESWVRIRKLHLVLTTLTADIDPASNKRRRRVFGSALHISPNGGAPEEYRKIALIPFGETIPLARAFPAWRDLIKKRIPQISEFDAGREFTVFNVTPDIRLAPMICFDAVGDAVARGMAANGANFGLVLANLSWFGRSNVSGLFEMFVRFRAMESRMPYLMLSQNGRSFLLDAAGQTASRVLGQFEADSLAIQAKVPETFSFFIQHQGEVQGSYALILLGLLGWRLLRAGRQG